MKIRILSDLHRELSDFQPAVAAADVVVLAGDIDVGMGGLEWAEQAFPETQVLYVAGNHEFYGLDFYLTRQALRRRGQGRIQFLDNAVFTLDQVRFIGCTLWTDFQLFDNAARDIPWAWQRMTDYQQIGANEGRLTRLITQALHAESRRFLEKQLARPWSGKTVVITHHSPSVRSIPVQHQNKPLLAAYASKLDDLVAKADLWIHGHIHEACQYQVGNCTVVCNSRGYVTQWGAQPRGFRDPCLIEI